MSDNRVEIELDANNLAEQVSRWSNEDVLEFIKKVDQHKGEWDLISLLKPWVDGEHRKMAEEELEDKAKREDKCQRSAEYPDLQHHVSPHKGCILR
jgi:hypothetical protein